MKTKQAFQLTRVLRLLTLVAILFSFLLTTTLVFNASRPHAAKAASVISSVTTNASGKPYIEVDGKPFLPLAVQYRADLHVANLSTADSYFADAKNIGFNTVSIPMWWGWIEPSQGTWNWTYPENFISAADQYGLKLEFLWYGTDIAGGAITSQNTSYTSGYVFPSWITSDTSDYQRHINSNGQISEENGNDGWGPLDAFSFTNQNTLNQEETALQALMNHIATYDTQHAVIGVQINNETMINARICDTSNEQDRSYDAATTAAFQASDISSGAQFARNQLANWQNALGQVVKQSNYPVYTRMNYWGQQGCGATFAEVKQLAPNIDFEGDDPYSSDIGTIRGDITNNLQNNGLCICENAPFSDTSTLMLSSYDAGGIYYSTYSLVNGDTGGAGLVNTDHSWAANTSAISSTVQQLAKDPQDIADHTPGQDIGYFHVLDTNASDNESKTLNGVSVNYTTSNSGMGVAIMNSNDLLLMGVNGTGTFTVSNGVPDSIDQGHFDANQNWVSTGSASYTNNGNGTFSVTVGSTDFIRLHYNNGIGSSAVNLAPSATLSAPGLTGNIQYIQDNNDATAAVSVNNPAFPQYITYTWSTAQSFDQVVLSTNYGQGQGITNFTVEVSSDGSTWTQVAASGNMTYTTNDGTVEAKTLNFAHQTGMVGLRIKVNSANLEWSHFAITEFKVFNANPTNLAPRATLSAPGLTGNIQYIQDNNDATAVVSVSNPAFPQYITYTWSTAQSFDQVVLSTNYGQGQGITNFTVEISSDGSTWTQVAASGNVTYATNSGVVETQSLTFPLKTGMVGLRIKVNSANLEWSHFAITEFKVFDN